MRSLPVFVVSALCLLLGTLSSHAAPAPPLESLARQVRQVTQFDIGTLSPREAWCVVKFVPREPGKTVVIQPSRLDKKTLEISPTGPPQGPFVIGTYAVLSSLSPKAPRIGGNYKWKATENAPIFSGPVDLTRQDRLNSSIFVDGGVAICKINLQEKSEKQFSPIYPIPESWQKDVSAANAYYQANRATFDPNQIAARHSQLRALLSANNPLIAVAAARVLARGRQLDAAVVRGPLARIKGVRQAALMALVLRQETTPTPYGVLEARAELANEADSLVKQQSVSGLKNLALGIYAAGVTTAFDPFDRQMPLKGFGPAVLRAIARRTQQLKITRPRSQDERELLALLRQLELSHSASS